jgi:hypothetical protein
VPLCLALSFALATFIYRLPVKDKVSTLESMEFRRPRLYTEAFGNDTPALSFVGPVGLYDLFVRVSTHMAKLKTHEGIGGRVYFRDNGLDLGQGDTELGAQLDGKAVHVGPGLDVKVTEETFEASSRRREAAKNNEHQCRHNCCEGVFFHTDPFRLLSAHLLGS